MMIFPIKIRKYYKYYYYYYSGLSFRFVARYLEHVDTKNSYPIYSRMYMCSISIYRLFATENTSTQKIKFSKKSIQMI